MVAYEASQSYLRLLVVSVADPRGSFDVGARLVDLGPRQEYPKVDGECCEAVAAFE